MILDHDDIRGALVDAWQRSQPDSPQAHEEGGFVIQREDGSLFVIGWPRGLQNNIRVPAHQGGRCGNMPIIATFHTHPNSGAMFQQEPSLTDIRAVRDDPDLSHPGYEGEYVISRRLIFRILRSGDVIAIGETQRLFEMTDSEA